MDFLIHKITSKNNLFLYHPLTQSLFRISSLVGNILEDYCIKKLSSVEIAKKNKVNPKDIDSIIKKFYDNIYDIEKKLKEKKETFRVSIEIKVNVSHECNLNCIYCYSKDGTYGLKGKMNDDIAEATVDLFERNLTHADVRFTFFGGEPLLNLSAIKKICITASKLQSSNNNYYDFGIITNGTIINEKILDLIKQYKIGITVSIDGPKEVHDLQRKFRNGKGTFDIIQKNVKIIQEECGIPVYFEATYTSLHESKRISREEVVSFLRENMHFQGGIITNVNPVTDEVDFLVPEDYTIEKCLKTLEDGRISDWAYYPLRYFVRRLFPSYICGIGVTHFVVIPNGDIYPCQLFVGDNSFVLGNVKAEKLANSHALDLLVILEKENNARCKDCWAKYLCKGCPGNLYKRKGRLFYTEEECARIQKNLERLLARIGDIRCDEEKYKRLIEIVKERDRQMILI